MSARKSSQQRKSKRKSKTKGTAGDGRPTGLTIRSYQVGFGDAFLLSFAYPDRERHVLVDFGSTRLPKLKKPGDEAGKSGKKVSRKEDRMLRVAEDIRERTGKKLDAIVVTHRHKDHLSGFERKKGGHGPGDVIRALKPEVVVQPWTEDPELARDAERPEPKAVKGRKLFASSLRAMHDIAAHAASSAKELAGRAPRSVVEQLAFLGEENLSNADAVKNLMTMGRNVYAHYGSKSGLEDILPGVKIHVLGPPTLEQHRGISSQRHEDEAEFWHLAAKTALAAAPGDEAKAKRIDGSFPGIDLRRTAAPIESRWLIPRLRSVHAGSLLELVRILDDAMNNTSLILLFEVGKAKVLFPGDAQIENWSYALKLAPGCKKNQRLLAETTVYKVGHHGSLNATPKSLWKLFKNKKKGEGEGRLISLLSSMKSVHGSLDRGTEVPRTKLLDALKSHTDLTSTLDSERFFHEIIIAV